MKHLGDRGISDRGYKNTFPGGRYITMNDQKTKYVVVYNRNIDFGPSVRHIVTYYDYDCEENFWMWYYTHFSPLDGDEMNVFNTMTDANLFARKIREEE